MNVKFQTGCPVKAQKFYKTGEGFTKHRKDQDLYVVGEKDRQKGIKHTSDVRQVQAYSSTATFIYSDKETSWEDLEALIDKVGIYTNTKRIYLYNSGDGRVKGLQVSPQGTLHDLETAQNRFDRVEDVETESLRDIRPEADIDSFTAIV